MRRRWRRASSGLALVAALAVGALASVATSPAGAVATGQYSPRTAYVEQHCPSTFPVYPPLDSPAHARTGKYYGVPLASSITGGSFTIGGVAKTTGLSATVCGLLRFPQLTASIPPGTDCATGCIRYGEATTSIDGLVDLPTTFTPGVTNVSVGHSAAPDGGLEVTISAQATATVVIARLGVKCSIGPVTVTLTTETSGPLSGRPVTGPLTLAHAEVVGATFAVPGGHASTTCPAQLIPATNHLVGLPAPPGVAHFVAPMTLANSLS